MLFYGHVLRQLKTGLFVMDNFYVSAEAPAARTEVWTLSTADPFAPGLLLTGVSDGTSLAWLYLRHMGWMSWSQWASDWDTSVGSPGSSSARQRGFHPHGHRPAVAPGCLFFSEWSLCHSFEYWMIPAAGCRFGLFPLKQWATACPLVVGVVRS